MKYGHLPRNMFIVDKENYFDYMNINKIINNEIKNGFSVDTYIWVVKNSEKLKR